MKFKPDITGPHGMAWKLDADAIRKKTGQAIDGTVNSWIVSAPWAHPMWSRYLVLCIHLRPIPGFPPVRIYLTGATHEVQVWAIDPDWVLNPAEPPWMLQPINFAGQFMCDKDVTAAARIDNAVIDIIHGRLNPDTDARRQWAERFGDNMLLKDVPEDSITIADGTAKVHGMGADNIRKLIGEKPPHTEN